MRATGIRYNEENGSGRPTERFLQDLCEIVVSLMAQNGFVTESHTLSGSAIKIGMHMSSFRINTTMLGHNARVSVYVESPKGYKRTNVPTWEQRVKFNNIVNELFNRFGLVANIKSGCFVIRNKKDGAMDESDWENQTPSLMGFQHGRAEIYPEQEAREMLNSDALEFEHHKNTFAAKQKKAKAYRTRIKAFKSSKYVVLAGVDYVETKRKNGDKITHKQFELFMARLGRWQAKNVKRQSIDATVGNV